MTQSHKIGDDQDKEMRKSKFSADIQDALLNKVVTEMTDEHRRAIAYSTSYRRKVNFPPGLEISDMLRFIDIEALKDEVIKMDFGVVYKRVIVLATFKEQVLKLNFLYLI